MMLVLTHKHSIHREKHMKIKAVAFAILLAMLFPSSNNFTHAATNTTPENSAGKLLEFSADAVQALPGHEIQTGKLYVSRTGIRFEFQQRGRQIVQIILPGQEIMRIIFPLQHTYLELKYKIGDPGSLARPQTACPDPKRFKCEKLDDTMINGLAAERWSITSTVFPGKLRMWWDAKRRMPLRQEYSDGRIMQATLRNTQMFEERKVENWEFIFTTPNGRYRRAMSLFAPDLGLSVIEQLPNGAIRRLHNIKVGPVDKELFEVPKGYRLIKQRSPEQMPQGAFATRARLRPPPVPARESTLNPATVTPTAKPPAISRTDTAPTVPQTPSTSTPSGGKER